MLFAQSQDVQAEKRFLAMKLTWLRALRSTRNQDLLPLVPLVVKEEQASRERLTAIERFESKKIEAAS